MNEPPVYPLQTLIAIADANVQRARAATQMTLGSLINALEALPPNRQVVGFGEPHSYRGYYIDLSFEPSDDPRTVTERKLRPGGRGPCLILRRWRLGWQTAL